MTWLCTGDTYPVLLLVSDLNTSASVFVPQFSQTRFPVLLDADINLWDNKSLRDKSRSIFPDSQTLLMCSSVHNPRRQEDEETEAQGRGVSRDVHHEYWWLTKVHRQLDAASVQLQSQGVRWLLGGGGHEQAVRPLGHEAQRQVLGLCVHGDRHDDFQVHAAVVAQHGRLWMGWGREPKT